MSNLTIGNYTAAVTIDGSTHYLLIQPGNSSTAYKKINRNVLLGVTGQPADISTTQTFTNKVLDNTNTVTLKDSLFTLQDNLDTTKQAQFQLSGITTATTRTYTLPDATTTLVGTGTTQTLTAKTLTSPTITGGSISNSSISVDAIAEFTNDNGVTIDGLNIKNGALNTSNSVVTSSITDGAVTPAKLQSGTGTGWSWSTWTPTLANLSGGTVTFAKYIQIGKTVIFKFCYTLAGAGVGSNPSFTLPVATTSDYIIGGSGDLAFTASFFSSGPSTVGPLSTFLTSTTVCRLLAITTGSTYAGVANVTAAIPVVWQANDRISVTGFYEVA